MSSSHPRRASTTPLPVVEAVPPAPPLPPQQPRYSQQARYALGRVLGFGGKAHHSAEQHIDDESNLQPLTSSNATAVHRTGLEINALSINESGTHALIAGRQIFKTIRVDGDSCAEDANIRAAIRTYNASVGDHGTNLMPKEAVDIHDVAWAKGTTGNFIAAATYNGPIILYDLNRLGIEIARLFDHRRQVHRVTFNPHAGHYMLSASQDGTVRMWDIRDCQRSITTFTSQRATPGQADGIRDVKWSPTNGTEFALGTDGGWIQKWDTQMMRSAKVKIAGHATACSTIDWHPDGKHLLSAGTDKAVRVWNVYNEGRRQKPLHEIRVPHPLRNARWRPSFQSLLHGDSGVRQCTQLVTSYDKDYPLLHIWDLRRPHLPFRELECYQTAPTDLLWHSQDLLWTVGREGVFTQSDVSFATKTIDKRNVQAFALSPHGELNVVTQTRRPKPDLPRPQPEERFDKPKRQQTDSALLGGSTQKRVRSAVDDTLDDNFLSVSLKMSKRKSAPAHESKSLGETPPSAMEMGKGRTLALDSRMERFRPLRPVQMAARGILPGPTNAMLTTYFAHKYKLRPYLFPPSPESLINIHQVFDQNASYAKLASMYRLSQSWRIIGQMISKDMRQRAENNRRSRLKRNVVTVRDHDIRDEISTMIKELVAASVVRASNPPTPLALPIRRTDNLQPPSVGSGSNMATPRAVPSDSNIGTSQPISKADMLPDIDRDNLVQLPPLVIEPDVSRSMSPRYQSDVDARGAIRNGRNDREDNQRFNWQPKIRQPLTLDVTSPRELQTPPKLIKHDSDDSFMAFPLSNSRAPSLPDSISSSHTQLMSMVAENLQVADSKQLPAQEASRPVYDARLYTEPSSTIVENGFQQDAPAPSTQQTSLAPSGSLETHSTQSPIAVPERPKSRSDMSRVDMEALALNNQESFTSDTDLDPNSQKDAVGLSDGFNNKTKINDESNKSNTSLKPTTSNESRAPVSRQKSEYDPRFGAFLKSGEHSPDYERESFVPEDFFSDISTTGLDSTPQPLFTLSTMLNNLITYHTTNLSDAQSLTALLLLTTPLLPSTSPLPRPTTQALLSHTAEHLAALQFSETAISTILHTSVTPLILAGLNPLQLESILVTYHEQLLALSLPINAALLRRLAYPTFPTVYETGLKENHLSFRCSECRKPLSGAPSRTKCEVCKARPAGCGICCMPESPYTFGGGGGQAGKKKKKSKSALHRNPMMQAQGHTRSEQGRGGNGEDGGKEDGIRGAIRKVDTPPSLFTNCLKCNHGAHAACLATWHGLDGEGGESGGVCHVAGCGCGCVAPSRPHPAGHHSHGSMGEKGVASPVVGSGGGIGGGGRQRVLEDELRVGESRAVQGARRALYPFQTGRMSGASAGSGGSGGSGGVGTGRSLG
ncbi:hypothetical protein K461DRAFT_279136 [Myriangium duriaei CBS 260.36]|uniref:Uncharacterized protein n=1 Tax=Myriangium duriaei CBS 260.36 TaxID=1168546 RepID=A0A9P4J1D0_9PEZI|nr:hypothetical protein K461DRAFT_279136 [Myriangium duriaei CBS 260.36]